MTNASSAQQKLQQPVVVVDANQIVRGDWRLDRPAWQVLLGLAATGQLTLVVPELIVRECIGAFRRTAATPASDLRRLGIEVDLDAEVSDYETVLRSRLAEAGTLVPDDDPIGLLDLVDRAIARQPPFNGDGDGFRDSILWAYVERLLRDQNHVVLLTADSGFTHGKGEDQRLHPTLAETATLGTIEWHRSVQSWLPESDRPEVLGRLLGRLRDDEAQVGINLAIAVENATASVRGDDRFSVEITAVSPQIRLVHTAVTDVPGLAGRFLAQLTAEVAITANVERESDGGTIGTPYTDSVVVEAEAFYDFEADELDAFIVERVEFNPSSVEAVMPRPTIGSSPFTAALSRVMGFQTAMESIAGKTTLEEVMRQANSPTLAAALSETSAAQQAARAALAGLDMPAVLSMQREANALLAESSMMRKYIELTEQHKSQWLGGIFGATSGQPDDDDGSATTEGEADDDPDES